MWCAPAAARDPLHAYGESTTSSSGRCPLFSRLAMRNIATRAAARSIQMGCCWKSIFDCPARLIEAGTHGQFQERPKANQAARVIGTTFETQGFDRKSAHASSSARRSSKNCARL